MTTLDDAVLAYCDANTFVKELKKSLREQALAEGICPRCGLPREGNYEKTCDCE